MKNAYANYKISKIFYNISVWKDLNISDITSITSLLNNHNSKQITPFQNMNEVEYKCDPILDDFCKLRHFNVNLIKYDLHKKMPFSVLSNRFNQNAFSDISKIESTHYYIGWLAYKIKKRHIGEKYEEIW